MKITATCHCGNISLTAGTLPAQLGDCNCSLCSRYKALWGAYHPEAVSVDIKDEGISAYAWGDKQIDFMSCANCHCITHYLTTSQCPQRILAVNFRLVPTDLYTDVPIQKIDGASWPAPTVKS